MNKKILIITTFIIILAIIAGIFVKNNNGSTVQVSCKTAEGNCTYLEKEEGKIKHQQNFDFKDVMQCNIETLYKIGTNDVIEGYKLYLALNNGDDWYDFKSNNHKNMAAICTKIFEKKPFKYTFSVKKSD